MLQCGVEGTCWLGGGTGGEPVQAPGILKRTSWLEVLCEPPDQEVGKGRVCPASSTGGCPASSVGGCILHSILKRSTAAETLQH